MIAVRNTVRLRLTLWNASVLALLLVVFATVGWFTLAYALRDRADEIVTETARAVVAAVSAERKAARSSGGEWFREREFASEALLKLRTDELDIVIADDTARVVAASVSSRAGSRRTTRNRRPVTREAITLDPQVQALMKETIADSPPMVRTLRLADGLHRAAAVRFAPGDTEREPELIVAVLRASDDDDALLASARNVLLLGIPIALMVSVLAGYALARRSLAPVEVMTEQAARISAANLEARLPVANPDDELGRLASVINDLIERVDHAFRRQRQFVAEASHELRTPIAIVRGEADVTLQRAARDEVEYRESLSVIRDETVRLTRIVDDLFLLASADAGAPLRMHEVVDLDEQVQGALRSVRSIADARGITLVNHMRTTDAAPAVVHGDAALLRRLVLNLLDNALKHARHGGHVEVRTESNGQQVELVVRDDGPGVPVELRDRIFDRFVRGSLERAGLVDTAGTSNGTGVSDVSSGAGLGLAIASAIAAIHRGQLTLDPSESGASFRFVAPAA